MKSSTYERLMQIGKSSGCHQMPERSFFYKDKQFPVCARCTGVFIGQLIAFAAFFVCPPSVNICAVGCAVMFIDWFFQYIGIRKSTNIRRLITGIIGGYSTASLYYVAIKYVLLLFIKNNLGEF